MKRTCKFKVWTLGMVGTQECGEPAVCKVIDGEGDTHAHLCERHGQVVTQFLGEL